MSNKKYSKNQILVSIVWDVADIKASFITQHKREPTDEEVALIVDRLDCEKLADVCVDVGWAIIDSVVKGVGNE